MAKRKGRNSKRFWLISAREVRHRYGKLTRLPARVVSTR